MSNLKNLEYFSKFKFFICHHRQFKNALEGIQQCMDQSHIERRHLGCFLVGEGGVGKSTICKLIKFNNKEYRVTENNVSRLIVPVFYLPVPSPITIKSLTIRMLEELGCIDQSGTTEQLNYRLRTLLKECKTQLIMLDEFHHIYSDSAKKNRTSENVANWIKTLGDETRICICLVGLPKIKANLLLDPQMERRYIQEFKLDSLSINSNEISSLQLFLRQVEAYLITSLNIKFQPSLVSSEMIRDIDLATSGFQSFIIELIHHSCLSALNRGSYIVEKEDFYQLYNFKGFTFKPRTKKTLFT